MKSWWPVVAAVGILGGGLMAEAPIVRVEGFIGEDPGLGQAILLAEGSQIVEAILPLDGLGSGVHVLSVRALDADGNWGPVSRIPVWLQEALPDEPATALAGVGLVVAPGGGPEVEVPAHGTAWQDDVGLDLQGVESGMLWVRVRSRLGDGRTGPAAHLPVCRGRLSDVAVAAVIRWDGAGVSAGEAPMAGGLAQIAAEVNWPAGGGKARMIPVSPGGVSGPAAWVPAYSGWITDTDVATGVTWWVGGESRPATVLSDGGATGQLETGAGAAVVVTAGLQVGGGSAGPRAVVPVALRSRLDHEPVPLVEVIEWTLDGEPMSGSDPAVVTPGIWESIAQAQLADRVPPDTLRVAVRAVDSAGVAGERVVVEVPLTSHFDRWLLAHFSAAERLDPQIAGPLADPDGDGVSNFAEYAFGSDPRDRSSVPTLAVEREPDGSLVVRYRQVAGGTGTPGVDYTVEGVLIAAETAADLRAEGPWARGPAVFAPTGAPVPLDNEHEEAQVRLLDDGGTPERMIRVRAGLDNP